MFTFLSTTCFLQVGALLIPFKKEHRNYTSKLSKKNQKKKPAKEWHNKLHFFTLNK